jgi:Terminase RNaseH-like domain
MIYASGLDLGQTGDPSAFAVLERDEKEEATYQVRHLERFPLGTSYVDIVESVAVRYRQPPLKGSGLAVDETGVGRAVADLMRRQPSVGWVLLPITITAGHAISGPDQLGSRHVPKKELVSALQILLQSKRLKIAKKLPEAATLIKELENFKAKITASANEVFEAWRTGDHDDLVLAVAMACWIGENICGFGAFDTTSPPGSRVISPAPPWVFPEGVNPFGEPGNWGNHHGEYDYNDPRRQE